MKARVFLALVAILVLATSMVVHAEEKSGIKIYDSAKYDASTSKAVSDAMRINAACYRTNDTVAQVTDFYKKQAGLKFIHESGKGSMFKKGNIDITIQNPWMDMKTGKQNKDTLISIVQQSR
jgi:hypothetical protein